MGCLLALASLTIIALEVSNLGNYALSFDFQNDSLFLGFHVMSLLFMSYMYWAVFKGLFALKIEGLYGLYPGHHTDSASLMFYSMYLPSYILAISCESPSRCV